MSFNKKVLEPFKYYKGHRLLFPEDLEAERKKEMKTWRYKWRYSKLRWKIAKWLSELDTVKDGSQD